MKKRNRALACIIAVVIAALSVLTVPETEVCAAANPGKTAITYLKSTAAGKVTVKYKKMKGCKYQIQTATSKDMKKNKKTWQTSSASKTLTLKQGKKYYVKVRAYKKVNGVPKYGKWSALKSVTVKKAPSEAQQVVSLVNKERKKQGLSAIKSDAKLQEAANIRAKELKNTFSHTRPNGTDCFTILEEKGIVYMTAGENIAMGQADANEVMADWMASSGHRANILNGNFGKIGVGYAKDSRGVKYWVQIFTD